MDSNGDGIPDQAWRAYGLDPLTNPNGDADGDGILNKTEFKYRHGPVAPRRAMAPPTWIATSTSDGLRNGIEAKAGTDLDNPDSNDDGQGDAADDADQDGLSNAAEQAIGTDPTLVDSDGNGIADGAEDFDGDGLSTLLEVRWATTRSSATPTATPSATATTTATATA